MVLKGGFPLVVGTQGADYDISPDGQRFLMISADGVDLSGTPPSLIIVQNWFEELRRLVPTN